MSEVPLYTLTERVRYTSARVQDPPSRIRHNDWAFRTLQQFPLLGVAHTRLGGSNTRPGLSNTHPFVVHTPGCVVHTDLESVTVSYTVIGRVVHTDSVKRWT